MLGTDASCDPVDRSFPFLFLAPYLVRPYCLVIDNKNTFQTHDTRRSTRSNHTPSRFPLFLFLVFPLYAHIYHSFTITGTPEVADYYTRT
jgi:hypothetical protein